MNWLPLRHSDSLLCCVKFHKNDSKTNKVQCSLRARTFFSFAHHHKFQTKKTWNNLIHINSCLCFAAARFFVLCSLSLHQTFLSKKSTANIFCPFVACKSLKFWQFLYLNFLFISSSFSPPRRSVLASSVTLLNCVTLFYYVCDSSDDVFVAQCVFVGFGNCIG